MLIIETKKYLLSDDVKDLHNDDIHIVKPKKDLTGLKFGALTVLSLSDRLAPRGKRLVPLWTCECECGAITYKATDTLTNKDRNSCVDCANLYNAQKMRESAGFRDNTQVSKITNIKRESQNQSGVRGVYYDNGHYRARIKFKGKLYDLGRYENLADAIRAREEGEKRFYGEYLDSIQDAPSSPDKPSLDDQISCAEQNDPGQAADHAEILQPFGCR